MRTVSGDLPVLVAGREDFSFRQVGRLATSKADFGGASKGFRSNSGLSEDNRVLKSTLGAIMLFLALGVLVEGLVCIINRLFSLDWSELQVIPIVKDREMLGKQELVY